MVGQLQGLWARIDSRRLWAALSGLVFLAGVALRAVQYLHPRSLAVDEAMLALNVVGRDYAGLLGPLDLNQAAPVGFLWLLKSTTLILGNTAYALRLFPFLASIAAMPLFLMLVRSVLGMRAGVIALVLLAIAPTAVEYGGLAKQYAFDLLATLVVLNAVAFFHRGHRPRAAHILLALAGSVTLILSHAVVFVTAGAGLALLGRELLLRRWPELRSLLVVGGIVAAAASLDYLLLLKHVLANEGLVAYWESSLPPIGSDAWAAAWGRGILALFDRIMGLELPLLGVVLFLLGLAMLALRRRIFWACVVLLPLVFLLGAVALDAYPFSDRLLLFALPLLAFGIAAAGEGLIGAHRRSVRIAGCALVALLLLESVRHLHEDEAIRRVQSMPRIEPVLQYVSDRLESGDALFVSGHAMPAYRFYTEFTPGFSRLKGRETLFGPFQGARSPEPKEILHLLGKHPRVWVIFTNFTPHQRRVSELLLGAGRIVDRRGEPGVGAFLVEFTQPGLQSGS